MDVEEYRIRGKEMVDYIAEYLENIRKRKVFPEVKPGYMRSAVPDAAPLDPEPWSDIMADVENIIMPGGVGLPVFISEFSKKRGCSQNLTHWQSPHMHAYFPALNSYPSLLGDMLADAINCIGFTWASSPASTELEIVVTDWVGKMIGLPETFLHAGSKGRGGGVLQTTSSEATLVALLAGRTEAIKKCRQYNSNGMDKEDAEISGRLIGYCSDQAHSSVEKAGIIGLIKMRFLESDVSLSLRGDILKEAIEKDRSQGLIPFFLCATLGTTGACAFDNLEELGPICEEEGLWLHVDAAYAGTSFICPEFRHWLKGVEYASSIAFNPSKWMMIHFDCTTMWVKNSGALHRTFNVDPLYLQHENSGLAIDYMHWQIPLSRRFRALKLWFVIRKYGIKGLQKHIREGVRLAAKFEALVLADNRFEIPAQRFLGLVVFRLIGDNILTERLLKRLNKRGNIHCVPASLKGKYVIRFAVTSPRTTVDDIVKDWNEIKNTATNILAENEEAKPRAKVPLGETKERNELFGSSLLLANSPMSPKIVNASFAAVYDSENSYPEWLKGWSFLANISKGSPVRRRMMRGKQLSLDSRLDLVQYCVGLTKSGALPPCTENRATSEPSPQEISNENESDEDSVCDLNGGRSCRSQSVGASDVLKLNCEKHPTEGSKVCLKCGHFYEIDN